MARAKLQSEFIDQVESELEEQLKEVIAVFQNLSAKKLLQPGPGNSWSIAACFTHLNSYADFYLPRLAKAIEKARPAKEDQAFKHSLLGRYFIKSMDPDRSKRKFKALIKHLPGEVGDPHAAVSSFIGHLENLLMLSRKAKPKMLTRDLLATSISPVLKINAGDAMVFLIKHNRRHLMQAKRLV
jgi:hypothetical protein